MSESSRLPPDAHLIRHERMMGHGLLLYTWAHRGGYWGRLLQDSRDPALGLHPRVLLFADRDHAETVRALLGGENTQSVPLRQVLDDVARGSVG